MYTPSKGTRPPLHPETDPQKHHHKCVCEICTCGKHSCPPKYVPFEGQTTHNHYYKPYQVTCEQQQRVPYNPEQRHYDPNLIQTTYKANYTPHSIHQVQPARLMDGYLPSRGKFQDETEYKKCYVPNQIAVDRPFEPMKYAPNSAKFDGSTTYKRQYSPKHAQQDLSFSRKYEYQPNKIPFEGNTTYQSEYKPHKIESLRMEQGNAYVPKNSPFVGESRYKEEYVQYQVKPHQICPTELLPPQPTRCSPGKDHLHFTASRNKWE